LEEDGILDLGNDTDMFCLHYVYVPRINRALEEFRLGWNHHALSTEKNQTPYQRWVTGVISDNFSGYTAVEDIRNPDLANYGTDFDISQLSVSEHDDGSTVMLEEPVSPLTKEQMQLLALEIDPFSNSADFGVDIFRQTIDRVAQILTARE
jgi:hypothetical protein